MPDISMCMNVDCPSRKKCYRYTAIPSPYLQEYSDFEPPDGKDKCDWFIDNKGRKNRGAEKK